MFGITDIATYSVMVLILILLPGPNSMYCLSVASTQGVVMARFAIMGTFLGNGVLIVASALGAGTLLKLYPILFDVLRFCGAVYLIYLGVGLLKQGLFCLNHTKTSSNATIVGLSAYAVFKKAWFVALLNPKGLLFFPAMMVQFVQMDYANPLLSFAVLGAIFQSISLLFLNVLAYFSQWIAQSVGQIAFLARFAKSGVGVLFLVFAIRLLQA